jgi:hypothetical protein
VKVGLSKMVFIRKQTDIRILKSNSPARKESFSKRKI